jgi:hypothetical protein
LKNDSQGAALRSEIYIHHPFLMLSKPHLLNFAMRKEGTCPKLGSYISTSNSDLLTNFEDYPMREGDKKANPQIAGKG